MKQKLFLLLFLIFSASSASAEAIKGRVINGTTSQASYPWIVSISELGTEPKQGHFCGGVMISSRYVLTAAHCVIDYLEFQDQLQITVGRSKLSSENGITVASDGIIIHPEYVQERSTNDIAIIRTEETGLSEFLPLVDSDDYEFWRGGSTAKLLGWGFIDPFFPVRPDNLQEAEIPIVSDEQCEERLGIDFDKNSMLCGGKLATSSSSDDAVDACYGDSGGPLIVNTPEGPKLAGLVSWGLACGSDKFWGVYTRLGNLYAWVNSVSGVPAYIKELPSINGRPEVGGTLACSKGVWGGDAIEQYIYEWHDALEGLVKSDSNNTYKVKITDIGRNLKCIVRALNPNGESQSETGETGVIYPFTKKLLLNSSSSKIFSKIGVSCDSKRCDFLLSLKKSDVKQVNAVVLPFDSSKISVSNMQSANALTSDSWHFEIKRPKSKYYKIYIRVIYKSGASKLVLVDYKK